MSTAMPHAGRPALYTVKQTAWILGVPASRIHRAIRTGSLPTVRHRAQLQIPATAVAQLLAHTASLRPRPASTDPVPLRQFRPDGATSGALADEERPLAGDSRRSRKRRSMNQSPRHYQWRQP